MHGQPDPDRLELLNAGFVSAGRARDGRATIPQLAEFAQVHRTVLLRTYRCNRNPDVIKRVVEFAARERGLDAARLSRWLCDGAADPELEDRLGLEARKFRCTGPGPHLPSDAGLENGWFDLGADADKLIPRQRRCKLCARAEKTEATGGYEARLLSEAHKLPETMRRAIYTIRAAGRAPTAKGIAEVAQLDYGEVRSELKRHGLEKPRAGRFRPTVWELTLALTFRGFLSNAEAATLPQRRCTQLSLWTLRRILHRLGLRVRSLRVRSRTVIIELEDVPPASAPGGHIELIDVTDLRPSGVFSCAPLAAPGLIEAFSSAAAHGSSPTVISPGAARDFRPPGGWLLLGLPRSAALPGLHPVRPLAAGGAA